MLLRLGLHMLPSCNLATTLCLVFGTVARPVFSDELIVGIARDVYVFFRIHQNAYCKMARLLMMTTARTVSDVNLIGSVSNTQ